MVPSVKVSSFAVRVAAQLGLACVLGPACVHPNATPVSLAAGQAETAELPAEFELLCWNTHKQRRRGFERELERFAEGAELVLLQEAVGVEPAWSQLDAARAWTMVVTFEYGRARVETGVATGTSATPVRERPELSPGTEPLVRTSKSALLTWVALAGAEAPLLLVNLHGINFRPARFLAEQLDELDEAIAAHPGPVILAGDLNTWSPARREVVRAFIERHALRSVFADDEEPRLDAVYVRGLEVRKAEVIDTRSSDHPALRVGLASPAAPP
jgi:endonuclease/exonuclease/phosphatase (EEP) superfamily protein YafD